MARQYRILIIGAGSIGERHVRCFQNTGRATVGICEINAALREQVAARYDIQASYSLLEDALNESWDAAVVATPANTHIPLAMQVVKRGISVLIEKPLAVQRDGVEELIELVEQQRAYAGVAYVFRAHPALRDMRDAILRGDFGLPLHLYFTGGQHFPTHRPAYQKIYYNRHETGGGALQDAMSHYLNIGHWILGPISKLTADAKHLSLPGVDVEDYVSLMAYHGSIPAVYTMNQFQHPNELALTVVCEQGTCRFELPAHHWKFVTRPDAPWQEKSFNITERDAWFSRQCHAWLNVLDDAATPLCTLREASQTLDTVIAAQQAMQQSAAWQVVDQRVLYEHS